MRTSKLALFLCLIAPWLAAGQEKAVTPFWLAANVTIDQPSLKPADVKLVALPDTSRNLALLKLGYASANYVPTNPSLAPFIPKEDTGYQLVAGGLQVGTRLFGDRNFKFDKLDAPFAGLTFLQTKMGHKAFVDGRYSIILSAAQPCLVFVSIDENAIETYKEYGAPGWLQDFAPTGHKLTTDNPIMNRTETGFLVFVKKFPAGRIVLGPPCMDADNNSMYFAFFAEGK
ncbi:MAG TPA: hypothetical protein VGI40_10930 [Pirellulaceae bacterium]|jgi:hypothetical protein